MDRVWYTDFGNSIATKEWRIRYKKERNYNELRLNTEWIMWINWLDPNYSAVLIWIDDIDKISIYWDKFMVYNIDELNWRAWVTIYDSMLSSRFNWNWELWQMLEYTTETLIKAKSIYNIDERLGFPIHNRLKQWAIDWNNGRWVWLYSSMKPYVEVQIFWSTKDKVNKAINKQELLNYFNK